MSDWNEEISGETWHGITRPCVYGWFRSSKCLYIGSSARGIVRLQNHLVVDRFEAVEPTDKFLFAWTKSIHDARELEKKLILKYKPKWNGSFTGHGYVTSRNIEKFIKPEN